MTPTPSPAMGQEQTERTQFDYLLNAFEHASQANKPGEHNYGDKRRALFSYVRDLEARAAIAQAAPAQTYIPVSSQPPLESGLIDLMVDGRRFTDCYFDRICDEWRKVDHCGHLIRLKRTRITHWLAAPLASKEST